MKAATIKARNPIVEMDGDEQARIIWAMIKEKLVLPFLDVDLEYYDLGLRRRDETDDRITVDAVNAIKEHGVGVKCATITPDAERVAEYRLKRAWPSPNGTIRSILDGTVFRKPIMVKNISPAVRSWKKPIIIGRHAYGDFYRGVEMNVVSPGRVELVYTPVGGEELRLLVQEFEGPGVVMAMHNLEKSIRSFAKSCVNYALRGRGGSLVFDERYDQQEVPRLFQETSSPRRWREGERASTKRASRTVTSSSMMRPLRSMKQEGNILWALSNYDGDVFSDVVAAGFGSLGMMTSVLISPDGKYEFEAAHGTVRRHDDEHLKGHATSTNSVASIFAWTGRHQEAGRARRYP